MAIKCLEARRGSPDGLRVVLYKKGGVYHEDSDPPMPQDLQRVWLREGWGSMVEAKDLGPVPEDKDLGAAPENKASDRRKRRRRTRLG